MSRSRLSCANRPTPILLESFRIAHQGPWPVGAKEHSDHDRHRPAIHYRRRADQRHRLGKIPKADRGGRLRRGSRGGARAGGERRECARREHGRGPARLRKGHDDLPQSHCLRAGHLPRSGHDRLLEMGGDRGGPEMRAGQGDRQFHQPEGRRRAISEAGPAKSCAMARPWSSWRSTKAGRPRQPSANLRSASAPIGFSPSASASRPRTSSSTRTSSRWRRASKSITITASPSSKPRAVSAPGCRMCMSRAASPTFPSPSAATSRSGRRCTRSSSTTRSRPAWTWAS